jgi:hypothetical protein
MTHNEKQVTAIIARWDSDQHESFTGIDIAILIKFAREALDKGTK